MCSRYQLKATTEQIRQEFGVTLEQFQPSTPAEYFPKKPVPVIKQADGERELAAANWGISLGKFEVSNSRAEKADGTWKRFMANRVVFPLSRAVEWKYPLDDKGKPHGKPTPWVLFPADESIAAIAGIATADWRQVSMMTTRATGLAAEVHNKKPADPRIVVFLTEAEDVARWLNPKTSPEDVADMLKPPPDGWLAGHPLG